MEGVKDLDILLKRMQPELNEKEFVFCTLSKDDFESFKLPSLLVYMEREGITVILEKEIADINSLSYTNVWKLITLNVHSDLLAVGFLARITNELAKSEISVNVVSAYYHDHLFVPVEKVNDTIQILEKMSKS